MPLFLKIFFPILAAATALSYLPFEKAAALVFISAYLTCWVLVFIKR
jgi:hypothetical protein